jgi:hypothetical protein
LPPEEEEKYQRNIKVSERVGMFLNVPNISHKDYFWLPFEI